MKNKQFIICENCNTLIEIKPKHLNVATINNYKLNEKELCKDCKDRKAKLNREEHPTLYKE